MISQLSDALKPGGFLKLSTPGDPRIRRDLARAQVDGNNAILNPRRLDPLMPLEHVNLFSARALKLLGHKAGLRHYRLPLLKCLGAAQLWNMPRQFNRNLIVPFKNWRGTGTYRWFQKPLSA